MDAISNPDAPPHLLYGLQLASMNFGRPGATSPEPQVRNPSIFRRYRIAPPGDLNEPLETEKLQTPDSRNLPETKQAPDPNLILSRLPRRIRILLSPLNRRLLPRKLSRSKCVRSRRIRA